LQSNKTGRSPGGQYAGMSVENLPQGGQFRRNGSLFPGTIRGSVSPEWGVNFAGIGGQFGPEYTYQSNVFINRWQFFNNL